LQKPIPPLTAQIDKPLWADAFSGKKENIKHQTKYRENNEKTVKSKITTDTY